MFVLGRLSQGTEIGPDIYSTSTLLTGASAGGNFLAILVFHPMGAESKLPDIGYTLVGNPVQEQGI